MNIDETGERAFLVPSRGSARGRPRPCYNFIREDQGLEGLTPAEMAGLYQASEKNRWKALLKKSLATQTETPENNTPMIQQ